MRKNLFKEIAKVIWDNGEDGEVIARDLAEALKWIVSEGEPLKEFHSEVDRLLYYTSQPVE